MLKFRHINENVYIFAYIHLLFEVPGPRGVLRFDMDRGVLLKPQNLYPSLRVILAEKCTHF